MIYILVILQCQHTFGYTDPFTGFYEEIYPPTVEYDQRVLEFEYAENVDYSKLIHQHFQPTDYTVVDFKECEKPPEIDYSEIPF